jgi:hypothetical protein
MKLINIKSILILFSALYFTGCEERIQIELDQKKPSFTVDAFLNNLRQDQKIHLTFSDSYFSGQTPPPVTGATVSVKDLTANKMYSFAEKNNGDYMYDLSSSDTIIYTDHVYELNVRYAEYNYKAVTSCKRTTVIDSVAFKYFPVSEGMDPVTVAGNQLLLFAKDATGPVPDYYWIKVYKNGQFYNRPENLQLEYFGYNNEFDGQYFWQEKWATSGPNATVDPCVTGDHTRLEIHGISRETFDFLRLGVQMSNNSGMFATTPVNLPTNIIPLDDTYPAAVGMFSVSDVVFKEAICP